MNMHHNRGDSDSQATDTAKADTRRYSHNNLNVYSKLGTQYVVFVYSLILSRYGVSYTILSN